MKNVLGTGSWSGQLARECLRDGRLGVMAAVLALVPPGCVALNNLAMAGAGGARLTPPSIVYQGATLVQSPAQAKLAAYYCPDVVPAP